jgi:hypothetical protein
MVIAEHVTLNRVLSVVKKNGGFLTHTDVEIIAHHDRLRLILVRCGNGRFLTPAQDVKHFTEIIARDGQDYVRDLSLPTSDPIWK